MTNKQKLLTPDEERDLIAAFQDSGSQKFELMTLYPQTGQMITFLESDPDPRASEEIPFILEQKFREHEGHVKTIKGLESELHQMASAHNIEPSDLLKVYRNNEEGWVDSALEKFPQLATEKERLWEMKGAFDRLEQFSGLPVFGVKDVERRVQSAEQAHVAARNALIESNMGLIQQSANYYASFVKTRDEQEAVEDLVQAGVFGLIETAQKHDKKHRLSTLAFHQIRHRVQQELMRINSDDAPLETLDVNSLENTLADPNAVDPLEQMVEEGRNQDVPSRMAALSQALQALDESRSEIISMHFGLNCDPMGHNEIAKRLNMTLEEVMETYEQGMSELSNHLTSLGNEVLFSPQLESSLVVLESAGRGSAPDPDSGPSIH